MIDAEAYLYNYFNLIDNVNTETLKNKMISPEFNLIVENFKNLPKPYKRVNNRLEIYYGEAGTGKTYHAIKTYPNAPVILGHKSVEPEDLFKKFEFINGQATFSESDFLKCMTNGEPIIIDEINLFRYDVLQTLQTITDGKNSFTFNGKNYEIKDGFKIIGTMNLKVGGYTMPLPQPLVDRASELIEFKTDTQNMLSRFYNFN